MRMIAVSDVHLGYTQQKPQFLAFLDHLVTKNLSHFVILGDFVDMWRRDNVGLLIENVDVFTRLETLQQRAVPVHIIAGNHDFLLRKLETLSTAKGQYHFHFHRSGCSIPGFDPSFRFYHGYEFDPIWKEACYLFDILCQSSDKTGDQFEAFYKHLQKVWGFWKSLIKRFTKQTDKRKYRQLFLPPEQRLVYPDIRKEALSKLQALNGGKLIFGHTHEPFVNDAQTLANTGSWCQPTGARGTKLHYNTFLEISPNTIELKKWINNQEVPIPETFTATQLMSQQVL